MDDEEEGVEGEEEGVEGEEGVELEEGVEGEEEVEGVEGEEEVEGTRLVTLYPSSHLLLVSQATTQHACLFILGLLES
jgi:hypothetical protein